jgi:hypothetical protein
MEEEAAADSGEARRRRDHDPATRQEPAPDSDGFHLVLTYFRQNNVEGLRIHARLTRAIDKAKSDDTQAAYMAFADVQEVLQDAIADAQKRADWIECLHRIDAETEAWYARELLKVKDCWEDLDRIWLTTTIHEGAIGGLIRRSHEAIEILDSLIFTCACQTIPDELDNYLANYRIGTCLDFISTFKDQLPDEAATRRVLETLAPQSAQVSGLVDVRSGKVIKADMRAWRQWLSVLAVLTAAGLGFGLIAIAVHLGAWLGFSPTEWPIGSQHLAILNSGYLLALAGVLGHWVLDRVKQNRAGTDVAPFSQWLMWTHVNEVPITVRIATVWLLVGLGLAFKVFDLSKAVQPVTFFTAGYFMDSTFDALLGRFNTFIGAADPDRKKGVS